MLDYARAPRRRMPAAETERQLSSESWPEDDTR